MPKIIPTYEDNKLVKVSVTVPARVALLGNPSDIANGKVLAMCIGNFAAETTVWASDKLVFNLPEYRKCYKDIYDLYAILRLYGYYGTDRLVKATCVHFVQSVLKNDDLWRRLRDGRSSSSSYPSIPNFNIICNTNIPRQVGLGGSSAIVLATWYALLAWGGLVDRVDHSQIPEYALEVEKMELGIIAGLQDRLIQNHGGILLMDFSSNTCTEIGDILPLFFLSYTTSKGEESGRVHGFMKERINNGDVAAINTMRMIANRATDGVGALQHGEFAFFGRLMGDNFELRRQLYGEVAIGKNNMEMVSIARDNNSHGKLTGSGGAIVGIYNDDKHFDKLESAFEREGYPCVKIQEANNGSV